jgi:hypothetical protein
MLTLQKVKPQYPIYVYISNHCFVQTLKIVRLNFNNGFAYRFPILFKVGLVEPTEDFRKSDKALVGRTLVKTNKDIPLRLMNVSSQPFMFDDTGPTEVCIILGKNM